MKQIYLLGGHDLEMTEIKRMLESQNKHYEDHFLNWSNAHLSSYSETINAFPDAEFFGIELNEDIDTPMHYCRIDHHNDYSDRDASILQIAKLLNIIPTHYIKLVAGNDSGYIPAMISLGATDDEIKEIRRLDRLAQGVTEEDEKLAEQSIAENLQRKGNLIIVKALTSKFSPICDRLYPYHSLLIYTDKEWVCYGKEKTTLLDSMAHEISKGSVYYGGGTNGYVGAARGCYSSFEIQKTISSIIQSHDI